MIWKDESIGTAAGTECGRNGVFDYDDGCGWCKAADITDIGTWLSILKYQTRRLLLYYENGYQVLFVQFTKFFLKGLRKCIIIISPCNTSKL